MHPGTSASFSCPEVRPVVMPRVLVGIGSARLPREAFERLTMQSIVAAQR